VLFRKRFRRRSHVILVGEMRDLETGFARPEPVFAASRSRVGHFVPRITRRMPKTVDIT
jgi:hypothetical protein